MATKKRSGGHIPNNRHFKRRKLTESNQTYQTNVIEYEHYLNCLLQIITLTIKHRSFIIKETGENILKISELQNAKSSIKKALLKDNTLSYETLKNAIMKVSILPTKYKQLYCGHSNISTKYICSFPYYNREHQTINDVPFILSRKSIYIEHQNYIVLSDETTKLNQSQKEFLEMKQKCFALINENNTLKNEINELKRQEQSKARVINELVRQKDNTIQKLKDKLANHMDRQNIYKLKIKNLLSMKTLLDKELLSVRKVYVNLVDEYETFKKDTKKDTKKKRKKNIIENKDVIIQNLEQELKQITIAKNKLQIICTALQSQMIRGHEPRREYIQSVKCDDGIERTNTVKQWRLNELKKYDEKISKHDETISNCMKKQIELFLTMNINDNNNINPMTTNKLLLNQSVEKYIIRLPHRSPSLEGQYGVRAIIDIPKQTVLSRYIGFEMSNREWNNCFDYSNKDMFHAQYLYTFDLDLDLECNDNGEDKRSVTIDPIEGGKSELLVLYINDCRKDILTANMSHDDNKHRNCKFVLIKNKGWPSVFIVTTKNVRNGQELFIDYGKDFWLLSSESHRWNKIIEKVRQLSKQNIIKNVKIHDLHNGIECHDLTQ
eukprot:223999_1